MIKNTTDSTSVEEIDVIILTVSSSTVGIISMYQTCFLKFNRYGTIEFLKNIHYSFTKVIHKLNGVMYDFNSLIYICIKLIHIVQLYLNIQKLL